MKPQPLPKKFEKVWHQWPTFDELRAQNPEVKVHKLRASLASVPCFRCPDQSARYEADAVARTMLNLEDEEDDDDEATEGLELAEPKIYDAMVLFRESMRTIADLRKGMAEQSTMMLEPLRLGLDLVNKQTATMAVRLQDYEKMFDRMHQVTENLMSQQADRDLAAKQAENTREMQKATFSLVKQYAPTIVRQLKPVAAANAALQAVETLAPDVFSSIIDDPDTSPDTREKWTRLRDALGTPPANADEPPQQQQPDQSAGHAA